MVDSTQLKMDFFYLVLTVLQFYQSLLCRTAMLEAVRRDLC